MTHEVASLFVLLSGIMQGVGVHFDSVRPWGEKKKKIREEGVGGRHYFFRAASRDESYGGSFTGLSRGKSCDFEEVLRGLGILRKNIRGTKTGKRGKRQRGGGRFTEERASQK